MTILMAEGVIIVTASTETDSIRVRAYDRNVLESLFTLAGRQTPKLAKTKGNSRTWEVHLTYHELTDLLNAELCCITYSTLGQVCPEYLQGLYAKFHLELGNASYHGLKARLGEKDAKDLELLHLHGKAEWDDDGTLKVKP